MPISFTFTGDSVQEVFAQVRDALTGAAQQAEQETLQDMERRRAADERLAQIVEAEKVYVGAQIDAMRAKQAERDRVVDAEKLTAAKAARAAELAAEKVRAYLEAEPALTCAAEEPAPEQEQPAAEAPNTEEPAPEQEQAPAEDTVKLLDYQTDVVPKVLDFVKRKGRDAAAAILGEFGVTNAKAMAPELWPELLERLGG